MKDKISGKPRGFAFIIFDNTNSVDLVLKFKFNHYIKGKLVDVKRAIPKDELQLTQEGNSYRPAFFNNG